MMLYEVLNTIYEPHQQQRSVKVGIVLWKCDTDIIYCCTSGPHYDGFHSVGEFGHRTFFTLVTYLLDVEEGKGGCTNFLRGDTPMKSNDEGVWFYNKMTIVKVPSCSSSDQVTNVVAYSILLTQVYTWLPPNKYCKQTDAEYYVGFLYGHLRTIIFTSPVHWRGRVRPVSGSGVIFHHYTKHEGEQLLGKL